MQFPSRNITGLPEPDKASAGHAARVEAEIKKLIVDSGGEIPFSRFMDLALYAPGLGYYVAGQQRFGAGGDFITAPELGDLFAQCLAAQVAQIIDGLDGAADVMEFGAGSGRLVAGLLNELVQLDRLPGRYVIVEPSPDLRQRQRETIVQAVPDLIERVQWTTQLDEGSFTGVVIANEVLDAMPVELFCIEDDGKTVSQACVSLDDAGFCWTARPADAALASQVQGLELPAGYCSEINMAMPAWLAMLSGWIGQGVVLLVDYGFPRHEYFHPARSGGTLMCHYRHHTHTDPLRLVGIQDITAHVDFTSVAEAAVDAGLDVLGFTSQAGFLMSTGLPQRLSAVIDADADRQARINHEVQVLTSPAEMGELFKVMALGKEFDAPLDGFVFRDMRGKL